jgi:hypothetical protein
MPAVGDHQAGDAVAARRVHLAGGQARVRDGDPLASGPGHRLAMRTGPTVAKPRPAM